MVRDEDNSEIIHRQGQVSDPEGHSQDQGLAQSNSDTVKAMFRKPEEEKEETSKESIWKRKDTKAKARPGGKRKTTTDVPHQEEEQEPHGRDAATSSPKSSQVKSQNS